MIVVMAMVVMVMMVMKVHGDDDGRHDSDGDYGGVMRVMIVVMMVL